MVRIAITKFKEYHLSGLDVTIYDKHGKRSRLCVFLCFVPKRVFFCATAVKIEFQIAKNELNIALEVEVYIGLKVAVKFAVIQNIVTQQKCSNRCCRGNSVSYTH